MPPLIVLVASIVSIARRLNQLDDITIFPDYSEICISKTHSNISVNQRFSNFDLWKGVDSSVKTVIVFLMTFLHCVMYVSKKL